MIEGINDYKDTQSDMRRWFIPLVGFVMLVILSAIGGSLGTRGAKSFRVLKYFLLFHILLQMLGSVFLLGTQHWEWAVQLGLTAIVGLFAAITLGTDYLALYAFICAFNLLALLGRLHLFGFDTSLYRLYEAHPAGCQNYFHLDPHHASNICYGYQAFTRLLAYLMVWLVAAQAFVSFYIYKEKSLAFGSVTGSGTTRTREEYGVLGSEDFGTIGAQS